MRQASEHVCAVAQRAPRDGGQVKIDPRVPHACALLVVVAAVVVQRDFRLRKRQISARDQLPVRPKFELLFQFQPELPGHRYCQEPHFGLLWRISERARRPHHVREPPVIHASPARDGDLLGGDAKEPAAGVHELHRPNARFLIPGRMYWPRAALCADEL